MAGKMARLGLTALAGTLTLALSTTLLLAVSAIPAAAMTQIGAVSGYPGDSVTIAVRNDSTGPSFSAWTLNAPPNVTIVSASGAAASGSSTFGCSVAGSVVSCGPSGAGGWAANNVVTMVGVIAAAAPAGTVLGTSSIPGDTGSFSVTVLPPPTPALTSPADGTQTLVTSPTISGDKRPGNAALALVDGVEACGVPADAAASWSCTPAAPLAYGTHLITATQSSPAGDGSPASAAVTITVLEPAGLSLAHSGATEAVPTVSIEHHIVLSNTGPGVAPSTSVSVDLGGFLASGCSIDGVDQDCAALAAPTAIGDLAAGAEVTVVISGTVAAETPVGTEYLLGATADSISDAASPVTRSATISVIAPPPPRITTPGAGSSTTNVRPSIHGDGALAGATVTVSDARGAVCTVISAAGGSWSCSPGSAFALGQVRLVASQALGGAVSAASAPLNFSVVAPPVPPVTPGAGGSTPEEGRAPTAPTPKPLIPPAPKPPTAITLPAPPSPTALPMSLRFGSSTIAPGTVATMRGELGPNAADSAVTISLSGRLGKGLIYRSVTLEPNGECVVSGGVFSCTATLQPGESLSVAIRVYADTLNAPDRASQQLVVDSSMPGQSNAMTSTIRTTASSEAGRLAAEVSAFPGAFIPLLALFLFALAATETERRRRIRPPATLVTRS